MNDVTAAIARRLGMLVVLLLCWSALPESTAWAQQQPPPPRDEYTPISELPPTDQIPAARLLIAAYSFVIVAVFLYVVSVARRLSAVQREVERLEADVKRTGRA
jgi:CcmD family protein